MGHFTIVYGYINGLGDYSEENVRGILALPEVDTWPYLTKDLFAVPSREHSYWDQVFTFGNLYNGVERAWDQWLLKFEVLLRGMYWFEAHVHLQTEIWGAYHYIWKPLSPIDLKGDALSSPVQEWTFSGGPRTNIRESF